MRVVCFSGNAGRILPFFMLCSALAVAANCAMMSDSASSDDTRTMPYYLNLTSGEKRLIRSLHFERVSIHIRSETPISAVMWDLSLRACVPIDVDSRLSQYCITPIELRNMSLANAIDILSTHCEDCSYSCTIDSGCLVITYMPESARPVLKLNDFQYEYSKIIYHSLWHLPEIISLQDISDALTRSVKKSDFEGLNLRMFAEKLASYIEYGVELHSEDEFKGNLCLSGFPTQAKLGEILITAQEQFGFGIKYFETNVIDIVPKEHAEEWLISRAKYEDDCRKVLSKQIAFDEEGRIRLIRALMKFSEIGVALRFSENAWRSCKRIQLRHSSLRMEELVNLLQSDYGLYTYIVPDEVPKPAVYVLSSRDNPFFSFSNILGRISSRLHAQHLNEHLSKDSVLLNNENWTAAELAEFYRFKHDVIIWMPQQFLNKKIRIMSCGKQILLSDSLQEFAESLGLRPIVWADFVQFATPQEANMVSRRRKNNRLEVVHLKRRRIPFTDVSVQSNGTAIRHMLSKITGIPAYLSYGARQFNTGNSFVFKGGTINQFIQKIESETHLLIEVNRDNEDWYWYIFTSEEVP